MEKETLLCIYFIIAGGLTIADAACPNGFTRQDDSCYHVADVTATWIQAEVFCAAYRSHLVIIETEQEQTFLETMLNQRYGHTTYFYTGLTDAVVEGNWVWYNSEAPLAFTKWAPGEPNEHTIGGQQDCMFLEQHGQKWLWDDANCDTKEHFICEKSIDYDGSEVIG